MTMCRTTVTCRNVGDVLHEQVVGCHAAINLQRSQRDSRVGVHRLDHVEGLPGRRLKNGAGQMRLGDVGSEASDDASRLTSPVRREQTCEGWHDVAAAVVGHGAGQRLDLGCRTNQPQAVPEPLHEGAGHGD